MTWDLSCRDWEQRLREGRSLVPDLPLYPEQGERAVAVLDRLRLADVTGTPTFGEVGGDWFRDIVRAMFGAVDPVTKARMIRELFLLVPKKHSKTTNGALLMLTALLLNERPRAPFMLTAPFQKTADEAFSAVAGAIALDPVLDKKLHVRDHIKTIVHRETKAKLEILTFDPSVVTGKKVVGALIDELHVLGKMARADKAMLQLRGGMQPFPEAFLAIITTQSDEAPAGVFKDDLAKARAVRDGLRESPTLSVLYEFPPAMQQARDKPWRDPQNWPMVSPNLGRSISLDRLQSAFKDEDDKGEKALRLWASQHLNIEIGLAMSADSWTGAEFWEKQARTGLSLDEVLERSEVVTAGIDGGGLDDLLGLAVIGRERGTGLWLLWNRAWVHPVALERRKSEESKYRDFEQDGDLVVIEELPGDVSEVAAVVAQIQAAGLLASVGMDPEKTHKIMFQALVDAGIDEKQCFGISQGWRLVGAISVAERKLAEKKMVHGGTRLMNWCVGNAKVEPRGNASLITKQASGTAKIDPLMATFSAVSLMALNPEASAMPDDYRLLAV